MAYGLSFYFKSRATLCPLSYRPQLSGQAGFEPASLH